MSSETEQKTLCQIQEEAMNQKDYKSKITGMAWPACPKCKQDLKVIKDNRNILKPFKCKRCDQSFEKHEVVSGWFLNNLLKPEFKERVFKIIMTDISLNLNIAIENQKNRLEYAKKCKHYNHESGKDFQCLKEKDGYCWFGSQYPNKCYEPIGGKE